MDRTLKKRAKRHNKRRGRRKNDRLAAVLP